MEEEEELDEDALLGNSDGEENYDDTRVTDRQGYHALEENTGLDNYAEHGDELLEEEQYGEEYGGGDGDYVEGAGEEYAEDYEEAGERGGEEGGEYAEGGGEEKWNEEAGEEEWKEGEGEETWEGDEEHVEEEETHKG